MSILGKIIGSASGGLVQELGAVVDRFVTTDGEKLQAKLEMERVLQVRDAEIEQTLRTELAGKERILVAELTQGDAYTKRARPTIIYAGLAMMAWTYCIAPLIGGADLKLPDEFWLAWGGVVGVYSWGRTREKMGESSPVTRVVTGSRLGL